MVLSVNTEKNVDKNAKPVHDKNLKILDIWKETS